MAATATAQSFNPQNAAADLRRNQLASLKNQQTLRDIPNITPANNNNFENTLSQEGQFAAAEQRQRLINATQRDILPTQEEGEEAEDQIELQELALANEQIRQESLNLEVSQLTRLRAMKKQLADQAAQAAADKIKTRLLQTGVAVGEDVVGDLGDLTDAGLIETDLGAFTVLDMAYKAGRVGNSFLPRPSDAGDSGGQAAVYTARKTADLLLPPYVPFSGTIMQKVDTLQLIMTYWWIPVALVLFLFFFITLCLIIYGVGEMGQAFSVSGLVSLLSNTQ